MSSHAIRRCTKCKNEKPTTDFYRHKRYGFQVYCKTCNISNTYAWRAANPEKAYQANRARAPRKREYNRQRYRDDPEARSEYRREWLTENKARVTEMVVRRRQRFASAPGFHSPGQLAARVAFYGGRCAYCPFGDAEDIEHTIPLSRGGSNWPANLRPVCKSCNSSKGTKKLHEWTDRIWDYRERTIVGAMVAAAIWATSPSF